MALTPIQEQRLTELRDLHRAYKMTFKKRGMSRDVLRDLLTATVEEPRMLNMTHPHPEILAVFREGRRSIGQHIRFMLDEENFTEDNFLKNVQEETTSGRG